MNAPKAIATPNPNSPPQYSKLDRWIPAIVAGVVVLILTVVAVRSLRGADRGSAFGREALNLLGQVPVQTELVLSEEQIKTLGDMLDKQRARSRELQELARDDREPKAAADSWATAKAVKGFLLPDQYTRLRQIYLQQRGTRAWSDDEIASELKLTKKQRAEISALEETSRTEMREMFKEKGQDTKKAVEEFRKTSKEQLLGVLSEQQQNQWTEMLGEPFKGELRRGRQGRGGGGGGGQRGGAGKRGKTNPVL